MKIAYKATAIQLCCSSSKESIWYTEQELRNRPKKSDISIYKGEFQLVINEWSNSGVGNLLNAGQIQHTAYICRMHKLRMVFHVLNGYINTYILPFI